MSRSSSIVSQIHKRRADRKKPKINAKLKKVSIAENQVSGLATASENKPPPITVQKNSGRNSIALTFSVGLHVLIAIVLGIIVIKDQITTGRDGIAAALIPQDPPRKIRPPTDRPKPTFEAKDDVIETRIQPTVVTNANIPNTSGGPTLPTPSDTDFEPIDPSSNEGLNFPGIPDIGGPIQPERNDPKPEVGRPASQAGPIIILEPPESSGVPPLPESDISKPEGQRMEDPRVKKYVEPAYPINAKRAQKEGKVVLQATIGLDGIPKNITALTKLGFGLEEAAIEALKKTRYFPAKKNGKKVESIFHIPFEFKLED